MVDYDLQSQILYLIRQQILAPEDECELFSLDLKRLFDPKVIVKPIFVGFEIHEICKVVAKLNLYTKPISVFEKDDDGLWISACLNKKEKKLYAVVSNNSLSFLYTVNLQLEPSQNMKI